MRPTLDPKFGQMALDPTKWVDANPMGSALDRPHQDEKCQSTRSAQDVSRLKGPALLFFGSSHPVMVSWCQLCIFEKEKRPGLEWVSCAASAFIGQIGESKIPHFKAQLYQNRRAPRLKPWPIGKKDCNLLATFNLNRESKWFGRTTIFDKHQHFERNKLKTIVYSR